MLCVVPKPEPQQAGLAGAATEGEVKGTSAGHLGRKATTQSLCTSHLLSPDRNSKPASPRLSLSGLALVLPLTPALLPGFSQLCLGTSTSCLHCREAWTCLSAGQPGTASPGQLCQGTLQKLPRRQTLALEGRLKDTAVTQANKVQLLPAFLRLPK